MKTVLSSSFAQAMLGNREFADPLASYRYRGPDFAICLSGTSARQIHKYRYSGISIWKKTMIHRGSFSPVLNFSMALR